MIVRAAGRDENRGLVSLGKEGTFTGCLMTRSRRRFQHRGQRSEQTHIHAHLLNYSATHDLDRDACIRLSVAGMPVAREIAA